MLTPEDVFCACYLLGLLVPVGPSAYGYTYQYRYTQKHYALHATNWAYLVQLNDSYSACRDWDYNSNLKRINCSLRITNAREVYRLITFSAIAYCFIFSGETTPEGIVIKLPAVPVSDIVVVKKALHRAGIYCALNINKHDVELLITRMDLQEDIKHRVMEICPSNMIGHFQYRPKIGFIIEAEDYSKLDPYKSIFPQDTSFFYMYARYLEFKLGKDEWIKEFDRPQQLSDLIRALQRDKSVVIGARNNEHFQVCRDFGATLISLIPDKRYFGIKLSLDLKSLDFQTRVEGIARRLGFYD